MTTTATEQQRERITVTFDVDKEDFEEAKRIMTKLTKEDDPSITLPLTDEQVAYSLYVHGIDNYFETYGDDDEDDNLAEARGILHETTSNA